MDIAINPGCYVVAVSGGVDSMVLLDLLANTPNLQLIVAHYDHGIRTDSSLDRKLVQEATRNYGMQFVYDEGNLGDNASEAKARKARYGFLQSVRMAAKADAIVTAHHQDDVIETAIINLLRGTGRRGLASLRSRPEIRRPLLHISKAELIKYAEDNNIIWREDSTNGDTKYLRNYIRHRLLPKLSQEQKDELLDHINNVRYKNDEIEKEIETSLHLQPALDRLDRHWFIMLPHNVASEIMMSWLRRHGITDVDKKLINRLVAVAKTSQNNRVADIDKYHILKVGTKELQISKRNR